MPEIPDDQEATLHVHREHHEMLPVWFFIGVLLLFYGMVVLVVGIRDYQHPPPVVLARYHANFWGGIVLIAIGLAFTLGSRPRRRRR